MDVTEKQSESVKQNTAAEDEEIKKDKLYETIGEMGVWQVLIMAVLGLPCKMSATWQIIGIVFLAPKTQYQCISMINSTETMIGECYSDCEEYEYITDFPDSVITRFGLICDKAWLANLTQTILMLGVLVGSILFGFIADRYGRQKGLLIASMVHLVLSLAISLSPDFWSFLVMRFFLGTTTAGLMVISFVMVIEIIGPNKRAFASTIFHIPLPIAEMLMPAFAYYLRSWTSFSLGIGIPNVIFLLCFFVPESPRWLITMGRLEEASKVMENAAKWNKMPSCNFLEVAQSIADESKVATKQPQSTSVSYIDLLTHPRLRMKNFLSCLAWFSLGVVFYGGKQYIGQTSSNVFITIALAGALQIPGQIISGYFLKRSGRRWPVIIFFLICGVCNGLLAVPDEWFYLKIVVGTVAVSGAVAAFTTIYTFTSELFPTVARNMAVGASSTTSRMGSMVAPFVAGMAHGGWIPPLVFAVIPILGMVACYCLPETKGKKLKDTLDLDD